MASKKFIRFYNDHIVRAVWDAELSKWWFSATDVVRAINDEDDYTKAGNYWRWLKKKLATEGIQLVSGTHDFKFEAPDGKMRKADVLDNEALQLLAKHYPNNRANAFLESNIIDEDEIGSVAALQKIHAFIFGGLYDFAGKIRTKTIWKDGTLFCRAEYLQANLRKIEVMPQSTFDEIADKYVEMNIAHPFMEGNGRSTRIWLDLIFKHSLKKCVDWSKIDKKAYLTAMHASTTNATYIKALLRGALTDQIDDREIFMKGIDYSYYYEQED